jgi:hypothetical protein
MAERMCAHIVIGGKLLKSKLNELLGLIHDLSAEDYWESLANHEYLEKCIANKKPMRLYDYEAFYGEFEELERFCVDNNLTFKRHSSPKYEYEGLIRFFSPDSGDHCIGATDNGEPYLKLSELKDYQDKSLSLDEVIARLDEYDGDVPPFELSEEPLSSPEPLSYYYEWTCPVCATLNAEEKIPSTINCSKCRKKFMTAEYIKLQE